MRARKRFGQHFLEAAWARKVVDAIAPSDADTFLEIGPGRGALTRRSPRARGASSPWSSTGTSPPNWRPNISAA